MDSSFPGQHQGDGGGHPRQAAQLPDRLQGLPGALHHGGLRRRPHPLPLRGIGLGQGHHQRSSGGGGEGQEAAAAAG